MPGFYNWVLAYLVTAVGCIGAGQLTGIKWLETVGWAMLAPCLLVAIIGLVVAVATSLGGVLTRKR